MIFQWVLDNAKDVTEVAILAAGMYGIFKKSSSIESELKAIPIVKDELVKLKHTLNEIQKVVNAGSADNIASKVDKVIKANRLAYKREQYIRELAHQPFYECTENGHAFFLNDSLLDLLGIDANGALGYGWLKAVSEFEQEKVYREWERAVKHDNEFRIEYTIKKTKQKVLSIAKIARDEVGKIQFIIGTVEKIES